MIILCSFSECLRACPIIFNFRVLIISINVHSSFTILSTSSLVLLSIHQSNLSLTYASSTIFLKLPVFFFSALFMTHISLPYAATSHTYDLMSLFLILSCTFFDVNSFVFLAEGYFCQRYTSFDFSSALNLQCNFAPKIYHFL